MEDELNQIVRRLKNEKAKQWRSENPEKVKEINHRYWIKKAKRELEKEGE